MRAGPLNGNGIWDTVASRGSRSCSVASSLTAAAAAFAALAAGAWEVSVPTGGTNIKIAPPAHHALASANAKARTALETVSLGEYRRSGPHLIVAAHGGVTATNIVGSVVTNIAGSVTNVVTNLVVSPLTVPVTL